MSVGQVRWALGQLDDWTWLVAQYRGWLIVLAVVVGGAAPLLSAARKRLPTRHAPSPGRSRRRHGTRAVLGCGGHLLAVALQRSPALAGAGPAGQRVSERTKRLAWFHQAGRGRAQLVAGLPAEWRAAQASVHTAIACALLAVAAFALAVLTRRRARRADIRQIVQEELRKAAAGKPVMRHQAGSAAN